MSVPVQSQWRCKPICHWPHSLLVGFQGTLPETCSGIKIKKNVVFDRKQSRLAESYKLHKRFFHSVQSSLAIFTNPVLESIGSISTSSLPFTLIRHRNTSWPISWCQGIFRPPDIKSNSSFSHQPWGSLTLWTQFGPFLPLLPLKWNDCKEKGSETYTLAELNNAQLRPQTRLMSNVPEVWGDPEWLRSVSGLCLSYPHTGLIHSVHFWETANTLHVNALSYC